MASNRGINLPSRTECAALNAIAAGTDLPAGLGAGKIGKLLSVGSLEKEMVSVSRRLAELRFA